MKKIVSNCKECPFIKIHTKESFSGITYEYYCSLHIKVRKHHNYYLKCSVINPYPHFKLICNERNFIDVNTEIPEWCILRKERIEIEIKEPTTPDIDSTNT